MFESDRIEALAALRLASAWDAYYLGLTFYGLGTLFFSYLWLKSCYIPRTLAAFGVLASFFVGFCAPSGTSSRRTGTRFRSHYSNS